MSSGEVLACNGAVEGRPLTLLPQLACTRTEQKRHWQRSDLVVLPMALAHPTANSQVYPAP